MSIYCEVVQADEQTRELSTYPLLHTGQSVVDPIQYWHPI